MEANARRHIAKLIYLVSWVASIAVIWQAVRFCQGHVGAPALDVTMSLVSQIVGVEPDDGSYMSYVFKVNYFVTGIAIWVGIAVGVLGAGASFGLSVERSAHALSQAEDRQGA